MTAGYSEKPLAIKLNLRDGQVCWFDGMPEHVIDEIDEYAYELRFVASPSDVRLGGLDAAHLFVTRECDLVTKLANLRDSLAKDGQIWVSWPKKGSGQETELDQDAVRNIGIAAGYIDTKKCAVDEVWSGLKLVIPKADR